MTFFIFYASQDRSCPEEWPGLRSQLTSLSVTKADHCIPVSASSPKLLVLQTQDFRFWEKKKSLGQGEREAHKAFSHQIKQALPFYTNGNEYIWKEHKKTPTFHWHSHSVVLPGERALCTLLKIRKGCVPWLSSWGKCTSGILGSDERNPLKFDLSCGPVACYAELQWVGPSCWCPHWWLHVFWECSVTQPGSLLTARTFQAPFLLLDSLTY